MTTHKWVLTLIFHKFSQQGNFSKDLILIEKLEKLSRSKQLNSLNTDQVRIFGTEIYSFFLNCEYFLTKTTSKYGSYLLQLI